MTSPDATLELIATVPLRPGDIYDTFVIDIATSPDPASSCGEMHHIKSIKTHDAFPTDGEDDTSYDKNWREVHAAAEQALAEYGYTPDWDSVCDITGDYITVTVTRDSDPTHPYFEHRAREVFTRASGNPDNSAALATWAQERRAVGNRNVGVIVRADGTLVAHTFYSDRHVGGWYVTEPSMAPNRVEMAMGALTAEHGPLIHVRYSQVCDGRGEDPQGREN